MEQSEIAQRFEGRFKKSVWRFNTILFAVSATILATEQIVPRWSRFDFLAKFNAVLFLILLVINPVVDLLAEKKGSARNTSSNSWFGSILAMLAILLFAKH
jgi:hypothetical protein